MFVEIHNVGEIRISLRRNCFRYSFHVHSKMYDSLIYATKGILKKLTLSLANVENVFSLFLNGFVGITTRIFLNLKPISFDRACLYVLENYIIYHLTV